MKLSTLNTEELKTYCIDKLQEWSNSTERVNHLNQVQDDRETASQLKETIDPRKMRSPIMYKAKLAYDVQARHMPYISPYKAGKYRDDLAIIDSYKDLIFSKLNIARVFSSTVEQSFVDGQTWIHIGTDEGVMTFDILDPNLVVFDPQAIGYCHNYLDRSNSHKMIARRVMYTQEEFNEAYPKLAGTSGVPYDMNAELGKTAEQRVNDADKDQIVAVDYIYGATCFDEPFMLAIAGSDGTVISELRGKDYKSFKKTMFGEEAFLPFVNFDMTTYRQGAFPMSIVSLLREVDAKYHKFISSAVSSFNKIMSKKYALVGQGAGDVDVQEELKNAEIANSKGYDYMMAFESGGNLDIKSFGADAKVINEYMAIRDTLLREASTISGINFMLHSEQDLKATVFLGKNKSELQAIGAVYKINEECFFNRLADIVVNTSKDKSFKKLIKNASMSLSVGGETIELGVLELSGVIDAWDGEFRTDTDLKVPASTSDTLKALQIGRAAFTNLLYATPFQSIEEIKPLLNSMAKEANMMSIDDVFGMESLVSATQSIIDQRSAQAEAMNAQSEPTQQGEVGSEEANKELSPNTALAEANII